MTVSERQRLRASTLVHARARTSLRTYDRSATPCIAHIGLGAFARAHLAVYADELLRRGQPALIRGVSIRSHRAQDQLEPQDGLFTVAIREPGEDMSLQVIGALTSVETGPAAALDALTAPATKLVTLTITEKGYEATADLPASDATDVSARTRRPVPGPAPSGRRGTSGLRIARQPPRQRQHAAGAGPRGRRAHRSLTGAVDRARRSLPQLGGRPDGAGSDRARPGGDRRPTGADRPGRRRRGATPLLDHPVGGRIGLAGRRRRGAGPGRGPLRASQALAPQRTAFGDWPTGACSPVTTPSPVP